MVSEIEGKRHRQEEITQDAQKGKETDKSNKKAVVIEGREWENWVGEGAAVE